MFEVRDLTVSYGGVEAVRSASLSVPDAGITCLIGRNGAGKSSLVNAIAGLVPSRGSVVLGERDLSSASTTRRARAGIALVPETRRVYATLSARENLLLGARGRSREVADRYAEILELFPPIAAFERRFGNQLSGGEQQMVAIGRALMCRPRLLVLDEPSLGLAPIIVSAVLDAVQSLATKGQGVLLIEQNGRAALSVSQRAYSMAEGRVAVIDHQSPHFDPSSLEALYL